MRASLDMRAVAFRRSTSLASTGTLMAPFKCPALRGLGYCSQRSACDAVMKVDVCGMRNPRSVASQPFLPALGCSSQQLREDPANADQHSRSWETTRVLPSVTIAWRHVAGSSGVRRALAGVGLRTEADSSIDFRCLVRPPPQKARQSSSQADHPP
jgi:hypothetical protein